MKRHESRTRERAGGGRVFVKGPRGLRGISHSHFVSLHFQSKFPLEDTRDGKEREVYFCLYFLPFSY